MGIFLLTARIIKGIQAKRIRAGINRIFYELSIRSTPSGVLLYQDRGACAPNTPFPSGMVVKRVTISCQLFAGSSCANCCG